MPKKSNNQNSRVLTGGRFSKYIPPLLGFTLIVGLWQAVVMIFKIPVFLLPSPSAIIMSGMVKNGYIYIILNHAKVTVFEAIAGFALGAILGFLLGLLFTQIKLVREMFLPYVVATQTIPIVAFAPIVIIWIGPGISSKIAIVAFLTFFPICLGTLKGIQSTERVYKDLFHSYAATKFQTFKKLELVSCLPYLFTTLRLTTPVAVVGAIVAEFVAANEGLGYLTIRNWYTMSLAKLWATILAAAFAGMVLYGIATIAERLATPWHESSSNN
jgi:NitT/TauT family transport system permease protein